jgi:excisionase family DNA binding protein
MTTLLINPSLNSAAHPQTVETALSTAQACEFLNISRQTLYKLVRSNRLPGQKIGDKYQFFKTEIMSFFNHES